MSTQLTEITLHDGGVFWTATRVQEHIGLSAQSFASYVSRGQAPAARIHIERTPLWDADEIKTWAATRPGKPGRPRKNPK